MALHERNDIEDLIIRYLDGYATSQEAKQVKQWVDQSAANRASFDEMKVIWDTSGTVTALSEAEMEADWQQVKGRLQRTSNARVFNLRPWLRIAAGIALVLIGGMGAYYVLNQPKGVQQMVLSDGTKVWLAQGAILDYPQRFGAIRSVELTGKAYFDVAEDPQHPFQVTAGPLQIEVLGTSFNLIYEEDSSAVQVASGRVKVITESNRDTAILSKNEQASWVNQQLQVSINQNPNYLSWKTNVFEYDGVPIEEVIIELGDHYGKKVVMGADFEGDCPLVATFEEETWDNILITLKRSCGITVKAERNTFYFSR